jgi:hypothetical protein
MVSLTEHRRIPHRGIKKDEDGQCLGILFNGFLWNGTHSQNIFSDISNNSVPGYGPSRYPIHYTMECHWQLEYVYAMAAVWGQIATAILLVDKKDTDEERAAKKV